MALSCVSLCGHLVHPPASQLLQHSHDLMNLELRFALGRGHRHPECHRIRSRLPPPDWWGRHVDAALPYGPF